MNTVNNKRRRESVKKIERIFIELLQEQELDKISVSDICKRAGLNRSTFYANFTDIYDLAEKVSRHLQEEVLRLYDFERQEKIRSHNYLKLFQHISQNQLFYKTYFKLGYVNDSVIGIDTETAQRYFDIKYIDYHIEFFKAGLNAMIKKWLNGGCKETPEEMEQILKSEYLSRA